MQIFPLFAILFNRQNYLSDVNSVCVFNIFILILICIYCQSFFIVFLLFFDDNLFMTEINADNMMARIDSLVERLGLTKKEFASRCGINYQSLVDWRLRGTIPSAKIVYSISQVLGVTMEYLITGEGPLTDDIAMLNSYLLTLTEKERRPIIKSTISYVKALKEDE